MGLHLLWWVVFVSNVLFMLKSKGVFITGHLQLLGRNDDHKKFVEQGPGTFQEPTEAIAFLTCCRSWASFHVEGRTDIHCQRLQQAAGMTGFGGWIDVPRDSTGENYPP